jgi:cell filamentation protein
MASLGKYSEYNHLEKILLDAICTEPIEYTDDLEQDELIPQGEKYQKYKTDYKPVAHEYRADEGENIM